MEQEFSILDKVKLYKNRISSRYVSVDFDGISERITKHDNYYVSTKLDGHFYCLCYTKGEAPYFLNPKGKRIEEKALISVAKKVFSENSEIEQCIIPGEIYLKSEERTRAFNLTKALTDEDENLAFAAFDSIEVNESPSYTKTTEDCLTEVQKIFPANGKVHHVDFKTVTSRNEISELFKEAVDIKDQEGLVVKTEQFTYKVKPKYTFEAVIVGFADSDGDRVGMFRDLLLAMLLPNGSFQVVGHLHHGMDDEARKTLTDEMKIVLASPSPTSYVSVKIKA